MNGQIIFVIWRESVEALLIVGILHSWLVRQHHGDGQRYLWGGVGAGLAAAVVLAFALMRLTEVFSGAAQEYLMTVTVFVAAALIVQMVAWMRAHGGALKHQMEHGLDTAVRANRFWGVFVLAMLAVAREGSETVIFLYGVLAAAQAVSVAGVAAAIGLGFVAAFLTYALLQLGSRVLPWRRFFQISEAMLLLLGCALTATGIGSLVSLGFLPYLKPLWDTRWLLDDAGQLGGVVAALTGYRAMPDPVTMAGWIGYGGIVALVLWRPWRPAVAMAAPKK